MKRASFYEGKPLTGRPIRPVALGKIGCGPDGKGGDEGAGALHGSEADPWTAGDAAQLNIFFEKRFQARIPLFGILHSERRYQGFAILHGRKPS
jgi:hypothetical protein